MRIKLNMFVKNRNSSRGQNARAFAHAPVTQPCVCRCTPTYHGNTSGELVHVRFLYLKARFDKALSQKCFLSRFVFKLTRNPMNGVKTVCQRDQLT